MMSDDDADDYAENVVVALHIVVGYLQNERLLVGSAPCGIASGMQVGVLYVGLYLSDLLLSLWRESLEISQKSK
eukprot:6180017-Amphidinium_carterae.1